MEGEREIKREGERERDGGSKKKKGERDGEINRQCEQERKKEKG